MKRKIIAILLILFSGIFVFPILKNTENKSYAEENFCENAKAVYVCSESGDVIYSRDEDKRLPIASMTKVMTSLIVFDEISKNNLKFSDEVVISEKASSMGGSQVFLDKGSVHTVENLLKSVIVASANDSAVALAEKVSGSENLFVQKMNKKAQELDLKNTNFANCTGLPSLNGFSSAKDVTIMLKELVKHDKYFEFSKIWLEDYVHPDGRTTTMTNTNKLVKFYEGCDGGKTGFTSEAKYCLSATAKRDNMRIFATVIGECDSKTRFKEVSDVLNYSFNSYENHIYVEKQVEVKKISIKFSNQKEISVGLLENIEGFSKKGENKNVEIEYKFYDNIKAPIKAGDKVGSATVKENGNIIKCVDVVSLEDAERASFLDIFKDIIKNW